MENSMEMSKIQLVNERCELTEAAVEWKELAFEANEVSDRCFKVIKDKDKEMKEMVDTIKRWEKVAEEWKETSTDTKDIIDRYFKEIETLKEHNCKLIQRNNELEESNTFFLSSYYNQHKCIAYLKDRVLCLRKELVDAGVTHHLSAFE
jgi:DNA-binding Lrp family transcriptional regulator